MMDIIINKRHHIHTDKKIMARLSSALFCNLRVGVMMILGNLALSRDGNDDGSNDGHEMITVNDLINAQHPINAPYLIDAPL